MLSLKDLRTLSLLKDLKIHTAEGAKHRSGTNKVWLRAYKTCSNTEKPSVSSKTSGLGKISQEMAGLMANGSSLHLLQTPCPI